MRGAGSLPVPLAESRTWGLSRARPAPASATIRPRPRIETSLEMAVATVTPSAGPTMYEMLDVMASSAKAVCRCSSGMATASLSRTTANPGRLRSPQPTAATDSTP